MDPVVRFYMEQYSPVVTGLIKAEAQHQTSAGTLAERSATAAGSVFGVFGCGFTVVGARLALDGSATFYNHETYVLNFGGTLDGFGLSVGMAGGMAQFERDPFELYNKKLWCEIIGTPPLPLIPPVFRASFYDGKDYVGSMTGPLTGVHAGMKAWGEVYFRK